MMYAELYEYLLLNQRLPLPGLGSFVLQRNAAQADFPNKLIHAPSWSIQWHAGEAEDPENLWDWLTHAFDITLHEARHQLEKFTYQLRSGIAAGDRIEWKGVGVLDKGLGGELRFVPAVPFSLEAPVAANKVIRERAEHMVRVGEEQRTAEQMTSLLSEKPQKKIKGWWIAASVTALLSVGFLAYYFSSNGWDLSAAANRQCLSPDTNNAPGYKQAP